MSNISNNKETFFNNLTILYVEDEELINKEISLFLTKFSKKVFSAYNGEEGRKLFLNNQEEIDLIITDINMPIKNGIQMLKDIREVNTEVKVLITTAYSDFEFLKESILLKVENYILKPLNVKTLLTDLKQISVNIYNTKRIKEQDLELSNLKRAIETTNIIFKMNNQNEIIYSNSLFKELFNNDINKIEQLIKDTELNNIKIKIKNKEFENIKFKTTNEIILKGNFIVEDDILIGVFFNGTNDEEKHINIKKNLINKNSELFINNKQESSLLKYENVKYIDLTNNLKNENEKLKEEIKKLKTDKLEMINKGKEFQKFNLIEENKNSKTMKELSDLRNKKHIYENNIEEIKTNYFLPIENKYIKEIKQQKIQIEYLLEMNEKINKELNEIKDSDKTFVKINYLNGKLEDYKTETKRILSENSNLMEKIEKLEKEIKRRRSFFDNMF